MRVFQVEPIAQLLLPVLLEQADKELKLAAGAPSWSSDHPVVKSVI
jgi:hypothetical protein